MSERDTAMQGLHDLLSAFGLLTRLPLPQTTRHRPEAAWCWPLVGLAISSLSIIPALLALELGIAPGAAAALAMAAGLMLTGAMHEDGLADSADGLFGGWTPERRLEIMKDSHIGSYGTLALIVLSLALWSCLTELLRAGEWTTILAAAALSRAPMAGIMALLPNARKSGLSATVGQPARWSATVAAGLAVLLTLAITRNVSLTAMMGLAVAGVAIFVAMTARRKIGGQTGDILGASQQLSLVAALITAQM